MPQVRIIKGCPKCGCPAERIEYKNSGPIIRIICPKCYYGMTEGIDTPAGELVAEWNYSHDDYEAVIRSLEDAQGSRLAVIVRYEDTDITGIVTSLDIIKDTFWLEMPGEFVYEELDIRKVRRVEKVYREISAIKEGLGVKVWLDDVRPAPEGYELVKSVIEAKALIEQVEAEGGAIEVLDLDHDLGDYAPFGGDGIKLLYYLIERESFYPVRLHTANPVGRTNMQHMIDRYWP